MSTANRTTASLIVVVSKGEAATRVYEKFGFISLPSSGASERRAARKGC